MVKRSWEKIQIFTKNPYNNSHFRMTIRNGLSNFLLVFFSENEVLSFKGLLSTRWCLSVITKILIIVQYKVNDTIERLCVRYNNLHALLLTIILTYVAPFLNCTEKKSRLHKINGTQFVFWYFSNSSAILFQESQENHKNSDYYRDECDVY